MSSMKQEVIVLSVSRYKILDKSTGELNQGTTVKYLFTTSMEPFQEKDLKGYKTGKSSLEYEQYDDFLMAPAIYSADLEMKVASDGKVSVQANNFEFKRAFELKPEGVK